MRGGGLGRKVGGGRKEREMGRFAKKTFISHCHVCVFFFMCVCSGEDYTQYSLHNVHQQYDWVMSLAKHPRLLQIVMACLGPDVLLLDSRFICKYPVGNRAERDEEEEQEVIVEAKEEKTGLPYVAWHQDMRFVYATITTVFTNV